MREIRVGLIGFGTVGAGVAKILQQNAGLLEKRLGTKIVLKRVADLDLKTDRGVKLSPGVLTKNAEDVISDPEIDIVMELIGGIEPARTFIRKAIESGKHIVTANKALLALHGDEIVRFAQRHRVDVNFEASVGGGIPLIRSIKEGLVANRIRSVFGILNGTSNYILSKMTDEGGGFKEVLKEAQRKGYAEADPTYDIEGIDAAHKLTILIRLAFGTSLQFKEVFISGISGITPLDIQFSREFGYRIKLLAIAKLDGGKMRRGSIPRCSPRAIFFPPWVVFSMRSTSRGMPWDPRSFTGRGPARCPPAARW